ncbi:hypothetical protein ACFL35_06175 [Candidatus Riflebacteria bacterium]
MISFILFVIILLLPATILADTGLSKEKTDFSIKFKLQNSRTLFLNINEPAILGIIDEPKGNSLYKPHFFQAGEQTIHLEKNVTEQKNRVWLCRFIPQLHFLNKTGGPGSMGRFFFNPSSIAVDPIKKQIFIVDSGNDRIVRLDMDLNFIDAFGAFGVNPIGGDFQDGSLNEPYDLILGFNRRLILSDLENNTIKEFSEYGSYRKILYPPFSNLKNLIRPLGITQNKRNNYYFVDSGHNRIIKIDRLGGKLKAIGKFGYSEERLHSPVDCAVDSKDSLYVIDSKNKKCIVFNRFDTFIKSYPLPDRPNRICIDSTDFPWILSDRRLLLLDENFRILLNFQDPDWEEIGDVGLLSDEKFLYLVDKARHEVLRYEFNWQTNRIVSFSGTFARN